MLLVVLLIDVLVYYFTHVLLLFTGVVSLFCVQFVLVVVVDVIDDGIVLVDVIGVCES